ncbi:FAD-dependent oxidoreductase [Conchiformibius kuhniae]|uniref:D-amino-acid oxidase n=1 Tax=Conchiformibius kuhniae TaxID=211502 RepID=A0A8T9MWH7_9NEIS|nr:FAD-dependent oxidoreductase [Conchiformibius kuhniae]UOP05599.1 FAD-binding oxidoreductase [Conchiformibius kuhniae]
MARVAVLGGGLLGRLTAWRLRLAGADCALFCAGTAAGERSAAYRAAAMLSPSAEAVDAAPQVAAWGRESLNLWRAWTAQLPEPVFFEQNGTLVVWHAQDGGLATGFERHLRRAGVLPAHWHAPDIAEREPLLGGRFGRGIFLADEGQLDGRQMLGVLARALVETGVACHWQTPCEADDLAQDFDWVADCRGMGAQVCWNAAGAMRLRGVRGEVVRVHAPDVSLCRPVRLLHPRYPLYVAPKPDHVFVVGATQIESEDGGAATVRSGLELLSALYALHPAFGEARVMALSAALRPTLPHHLPEIRLHPRRRVVEANGLFRHGFMIAPVVCAALCRVVASVSGGGALPEYDVPNGLDWIVMEET